MNEKPKMYQNKIDKEIHNNKLVYTSFEKESVKETNWNITDIRKKINDIINSKTFIYSKLVNIVIGNDTIKRKIVGIYNNSLVTIDNEYIPINNIKDIYV